jgi:hypothetical protein
MTVEELRHHIKARPFRPFSLHVADGRTILVSHHDFILVSPSGRIIYVFQPDDSHDILDIMLITGISFGPSPAPATSSGDGP